MKGQVKKKGKSVVREGKRMSFCRLLATKSITFFDLPLLMLLTVALAEIKFHS